MLPDGGTDAGGSGSGGASGTGGSDSVVPPVTGPAEPEGISGLVRSIVGIAGESAGRVIRPEAAAAVAATFGFPLVLALLVILFLVLQPRLDERDPKLRGALRMPADAVIGFEDDPA